MAIYHCCVWSFRCPRWALSTSSVTCSSMSRTCALLPAHIPLQPNSTTHLKHCKFEIRECAATDAAPRTRSVHAVAANFKLKFTQQVSRCTAWCARGSAVERDMIEARCVAAVPLDAMSASHRLISSGGAIVHWPHFRCRRRLCRCSP